MAYDDDPKSIYYAREDRRRQIEHDSEYWHSESGQYHLKYNSARNAEVSERNAEIFHNLNQLYLSINVSIILIVSVVFSMFSKSISQFVMSVITWNFLILLLILAYFYLTAKT